MKKLSPEAFREKIQAYFDQISYLEPVYQEVQTGEFAKNGKPLVQREIAKSDDGQELFRREYSEEPSVSSLCLFLGMTRRTFQRYANDPKYEEAAAFAKLKMESFWVHMLCTKANFGARFALNVNYGWNLDGSWYEKTQIDLGEQTRNALSVSNMSLKEKMALIAKAAETVQDGGQA